jgi:hypothetical protein
MAIPKIIWITIAMFVLISANAFAITLSDQGTDVRVKSTGLPVNNGNLTISIWTDVTGGTNLYSYTFNNTVNNGTWNIMLGQPPGPALDLNYSVYYYKDYTLNGEDIDFVDGTGATVERQIFQSPLGNITNDYLVEMSSSGNTSFNQTLTDSLYVSQTGIDLDWFYFTGSTLYFNETHLNDTISAYSMASDTQKTAGGIYLYNDSTTIYVNESSLNNTVDSRIDNALAGDVTITGSLTVLGDYINATVEQQIMNGSIYPAISDTFDIGSATMVWNEVHANNLYGALDCSNITGATSNLCTLVDTDTDTQLNESQVDAFVNNNGYLTSSNTTGWDTNASDDFNGEWSNLSNIPSDILDGDNDTLGDLSCGDNQVIRYNATSGSWMCINALSFTDTTLNQSQIEDFGFIRDGDNITTLGLNYLTLNISGNDNNSGEEGVITWNPIDKAINVGTGEGATLQVGQESYTRAVNLDTVQINEGDVVYISGASGITPGVELATSNDAVTSKIIGIATVDIPVNGTGFITTHGLVRDLNTSGFTPGDTLYLSPTVPGGYQSTVPVNPSYIVIVGTIVVANGTTGTIYVDPVLDPDVSPFTINVATEGGDFDSIQSAIDSITDASADKLYTIKVYPGRYSENVEMKDWVDLEGVGGWQSIINGTVSWLDADNSADGWSNMLQMAIEYEVPSGVTDVIRVEDGLHDIHNCYFLTEGDSHTWHSFHATNGSTTFYMTEFETIQTGNTASSNHSATIHIDGEGDVSFYNGEIYLTTTISNRGAIAIEIDSDTSSVHLQGSDIEISSSSNTTAIFFDLDSIGEENYIHGNNVIMSGSSNGTGKIYEISNVGIIHSTSNKLLVEGFNENYFSSVASGSHLYSTFDNIDAVDGTVGSSDDYDYVSSLNDGSLTVTENINVGEGQDQSQDLIEILIGSATNPVFRYDNAWNGYSALVWDYALGEAVFGVEATDDAGQILASSTGTDAHITYQAFVLYSDNGSTVESWTIKKDGADEQTLKFLPDEIDANTPLTLHYNGSINLNKGELVNDIIGEINASATDIQLVTASAIKTYVDNQVTSMNGSDPEFDGWDKNASDDFNGQYSNLSGAPVNLSQFVNDIALTNGTDGINGTDGTSVNFTSITNLGNGSYEWNFSDGTQYITGDLTGPQGIQGIAGVNGTDGINGVNGTDGVDGTNLTLDSVTALVNGSYTWNFSDGTSYTTANLTGPQGPQGIQGIQGVAGTNGTDGINGINGTNGVNGTTFNVGDGYLYDNGSNVIFFNETALNNSIDARAPDTSGFLLNTDDTFTGTLQINGTLNITDHLMLRNVHLAGAPYAATTGLVSGGDLDINPDNTAQLFVASGVGIYADYSDPVNPVIEELSWSNTTIVPNVTGIRSKWIGIQRSGPGIGTITTAQEFTALQKRTIIILGRVWGNGQVNMTGRGEYATTAYGIGTSLEDLAWGLGSFNKEGNVFSANGANLLLNRTAGVAFRWAAGHGTTPESPNIRTSTSEIGLGTYYYHVQNRTFVDANSSIIPTHYDNVGVLTPVPAGNWTVQRVYYFPASTTHVTYGQELYDTMQDAIAGISDEPVELNSEILEGSILRAFLVLKGSATDLSDSNNASIVEYTGFSTGTGGGGGATVEADPIFTASSAFGITASDISEWDTAYSWGDHSGEGYLTSETDPNWAGNFSGYNKTAWDLAYSWGDHSTEGYLTSYTETDPLWSANYSGYNKTAWDLAYSWGDHSTEGYLTSYTETDPLWSANYSGYNKTAWDLAYSWGDHALAGYLTSYTETDPLWSANYSGYNKTAWDLAYSWGDHALAGYLTSYTETDPLWSGNSTLVVYTANTTNWDKDNTDDFVSDQALNTTSNVAFNTVNSTGNVTITGAGGCLNLPGGGYMCSNSSHTWIG